MAKWTLLAMALILTACGGSPNSSLKNGTSTQPPAGSNNRGNSAPAAGGGREASGEENRAAVDFENPLGFYSVHAKGIPEAVRTAGDSVFILKVLSASDLSTLKEVDVSNGQGKALKEKLRAKSASVAEDMDRTVLIKEIEKCEKFQEVESQKHCILTYEIRQGTGFLTGDGTTLWTNAHVIEGFMNLIELAKKESKADQLRKKQRLSIYIFSHDGQLLLNPNVDQVKIKTAPELTNVARARKKIYAEDSDYVGISLARSIGKGLKIAKQKIAYGQRIFALGYPACTGCNPTDLQIDDPADFSDRSPGPNSDGNGLKVSTGTVLDPSGLESFFGMQRGSMDQWRLDRMFFHSADSNHGSSGGPLVNEKGEVVALHAGGKSKIVGGKHERISRSVVPAPFLAAP